jgi:hypothetical protein
MYPAVILATGDRNAGDSGFNLLFVFITGSNHTRNRIPMTSPVITSHHMAITELCGIRRQVDVICDAAANRPGGYTGPAGQPGVDHYAARQAGCRSVVSGDMPAG